MTVTEINKLIQELPSEERGKVSDGYHTIDEIYEHRYQLFIALCKLQDEYNNVYECFSYRPIWRSKLHSDGTMFKDMFIMGFETLQDGNPRVIPNTRITYHLPISKWEECNFAATYANAPEWDGATSNGVINRLKSL